MTDTTHDKLTPADVKALARYDKILKQNRAARLLIKDEAAIDADDSLSIEDHMARLLS